MFQNGTVSPYVFIWTILDKAGRVYKVQSKAYDSASNQGLSILS